MSEALVGAGQRGPVPADHAGQDCLPCPACLHTLGRPGCPDCRPCQACRAVLDDAENDESPFDPRYLGPIPQIVPDDDERVYGHIQIDTLSGAFGDTPSACHYGFPAGEGIGRRGVAGLIGGALHRVQRINGRQAQ